MTGEFAVFQLQYCNKHLGGCVPIRRIATVYHGMGVVYGNWGNAQGMHKEVAGVVRRHCAQLLSRTGPCMP